jgi:hypothetical protein
MTQPAYCTILARNYLPAAITLSESLLRHGDGTPLTIFLIDATDETELPEIEGVRWMHPGMLGLPDRTVHELAMSYDLVEFATAVKPLVLAELLGDHEHAAYLDPDTYVVSPMEELAPALEASAGGIILTPHYIDPPPPGNLYSEGHLLHVGFYNLGFCGVSRRAEDFLAWWWGHLRNECLHDPLSGLFVDQKWCDVGSGLFGASSLRHRGYNVSVANLHERPIERDGDGYYVAGTDDRLRLFHFHSFDPRRPDELATRRAFASAQEGGGRVQELAREYADIVLAKEQELGPQPAYPYNADTTGRRIARRTRHAYRVASQAAPGTLPSPFAPAEAEDYERWRRGSRRLAGRLMVSDVAKAMRMALPEEYERVKKRLPGLTNSVRGRFVQRSGWLK